MGSPEYTVTYSLLSSFFMCVNTLLLNASNFSWTGERRKPIREHGRLRFLSAKFWYCGS